MDWLQLRKGATLLHVAYANTHTNNLTARDVRLYTKPSLELHMDLNHNLRARNKQGNSYFDARELADGKIARLELLQIDDSYIIDGLLRALKRTASGPAEWTLTIELEGAHSFKVRPERRSSKHSLFLRVIPSG
jgi:hypothetical protein